MFYVYALRSLKDGNLYIGMTSNVELRLIEHNRGNTKSTKSRRPFKLIFKSNSVANRLEARNLEKYYKTGCGRELLKQL